MVKSMMTPKRMHESEIWLYKGISTNYVDTHAQISAPQQARLLYNVTGCLLQSTLRYIFFWCTTNAHTQLSIVLHRRHTEQSTYQSGLRRPNCNNGTTGDGEEYLRCQRRLEMKRMNAKHVREQEHHKRTILKMIQNEFFKQKKITFWDGDKDNNDGKRTLRSVPL